VKQSLAGEGLLNTQWTTNAVRFSNKTRNVHIYDRLHHELLDDCNLSAARRTTGYGKLTSFIVITEKNSR